MRKRGKTSEICGVRVKKPNIQVIRNPKGEAIGTEKIFEEILVKNIPNLVKDKNLQIQAVH